MNSIAQNINESLRTVLPGMGIVMVALYGHSSILDFMKEIFSPQARSVKKNEGKGEQINEINQEDASTPDQEPSHEQDDGELVAVITAALSEYLQKPMTHVRVGRIRQIHTTTPEWGRAARYENVYNNI